MKSNVPFSWIQPLTNAFPFWVLLAVAIPCAISSVTHSLIGSLLAAYWRRHPVEPQLVLS